MTTSFLISIFMYLGGAEFTLPVDHDGVGLWLAALGKEFSPGDPMSYREFIRVALLCKWMNVAARAQEDDPHFGEGELALIFDAVCMNKFGSSRPSSRAVTPREKKKKEKRGSQSARTQRPVIAQTVGTRREYEQLIVQVAQRQLKTPLHIMLDLKKQSLAAKDLPPLSPTSAKDEGGLGATEPVNGEDPENSLALLTSRSEP
jgi:hypothetical protein